MEIIEIAKGTRVPQDSYIALGNFDGVHQAHRALLETLVARARARGLAASVLNFSNHTKDVLGEGNQPLLTSSGQKHKIFEDLGLDYVYEVPFDRTLMTMSPQAFVQDLLLDRLRVRGVVVGFDYRFGHKASGNVKTLRDLGQDLDFDLKVLDPVELEGIPVSSTLIRQRIRQGKMEEASLLLGRPYRLEGVVETGKGLGKKIGIPTANLRLAANYCVPKHGVYLSYLHLGYKTCLAATNIGSNPTFNETGLKVEAHLIDFEGDLYGQEVALDLVSFIREEEAFASLEDLVDQMKRDIALIKDLDRGTIC